MATSTKKGKGNKDGEKKSAKKPNDTLSVQESKGSIPIETEQPTPCTESPPPANTIVEQQITPEIPPQEIVYQEPVLPKLIVERYEGEKSKGNYDGQGEAYFRGGHSYIGQFSEGFMHGRGIYTWSDGVQYEGDFVQNSITGNGIYRWLDGSTYEGQVLNGRYNGFGVFRLPDGQRSYSGEWVMGEKHGKGMMAYDCEGRSYYNGDWVHNIKQGYGKRQYPSGNIYEGSWFDNVRQGEGVMKWFDKRGNITDLYSGLWEYGEQHGFGHHIWFLKRVVSSQYPLRNMYTGDFVKGRRQGFGVFVYANGARYEGMWCDNKKHGKGKFIFKNGRVYEGEFENDRTTEYPEMDLAALATPDQSRIRTRTPLPREISNASVSSNNTYSPSLQLQLAYLLRQLPEADRDEEQRQLMLTVTRHMTSLRRIYTFYSCVGCMEIDEKGCSYPDNTYVMGRLQLWRCLKDSRLHYEDITLSEMDCILAAAAEGTGDEDIHSPATSILFREFLHFIIILAFHIYHSKHTGSDAVTSWCLSKLMTEKLNKYACSIKGFIYNDSRRTFQVQPYQDKTYEIYKTFAKTRKQAPYDKFMTMRQFLFLMKDLKLINSDLTAKAVIDILASDDPKVRDVEGSINMELEMTFLEFFEALVGCAEVYVTEEVRKEPNSPPHSVLMTHTHSVMSFYGNHSHEPSQFGLDDMSAANLGDDGAMSPDGQETPGGHSASRSRAEARQRPEAVASTGSVLDAETFRKAETPKDGPGEAASRLSDAQGGLVQSNASVKADNCFDDDNVTGANGVLDAAEEGTEFNDDEELDEDIKKFNMWTYQIHIFFKKKFFPAAQHFAELCDTVRSSNSIPQKVEITP